MVLDHLKHEIIDVPIVTPAELFISESLKIATMVTFNQIARDNGSLLGGTTAAAFPFLPWPCEA
jgi:hypothetical protein